MHFPAGVFFRDGQVVLVMPQIDYNGLTDTMWHMIRQSAVGNAAVLIHMLEVIAVVARCERSNARRIVLYRHAITIWHEAEQTVHSVEDMFDIRWRLERAHLAISSPRE